MQASSQIESERLAWTCTRSEGQVAHEKELQTLQFTICAQNFRCIQASWNPGMNHTTYGQGSVRKD